MPRSMTGYGIGQVIRDGLAVDVEVRSVNNRFLEISLRTPRALNSREQELREFFQDKVARGRLSVYVSEQWEDDQGLPIRLDRGKAFRYAEALDALRDELGLGGELRLEHLLAVDRFFTIEEDENYRELLWNLTLEASRDALDQFLAVSLNEGDVLVKDMLQRVAQVESELQIVKSLVAGQVKEYRERLEARLGELMNDSRFDRTRLEFEVTLAADRLDISEEITRLDSHIILFRKTAKRKEPVGKGLSFILQEMGREVNTLTSKSWDVEIAQAGIRMKEILEQVREQVMNLE